MRVTPQLDTIGSIPIKADAGVEREPDITFDGVNYIVVWSEGEFGGAHSVRAARVTPQGTVIDSGIPFGAGAYVEQRPGIAYDGVRCMAIWYHYQCTPYGVFGRFINSQAQPEGATITIRTTTNSNYFEPDIAFSAGNYLIVWNEGIIGSGDDVFGQIVDSDGQLIGGVIPIAVGAAYESNPRICSADNGFLVVFSQSSNIYGQWVSASGQLVGVNFEISDPGTCDRAYPDAAAGTNNCLTVWQQFSNNSYDIYGNVDISFGVNEADKSFAQKKTFKSLIVAGSVKEVLGQERYSLYDTSGRKIEAEPAAPGVYFAEMDNQTVTKIVKIR